MKQLVHRTAYDPRRMDAEHPAQCPDGFIFPYSSDVRATASPFRDENVTVADILSFLLPGAVAVVCEIWNDYTATARDS